MKNFAGRIVMLGIAALAVASALTMSSCRDKFMTQVDTVLVHDTTVAPDLDDSSVWTPRLSGVTSGLTCCHFATTSVGYVGGDNGIVLKTTDSGTTWQRTPAAVPISGGVGGGTTVYGIWFFDANNGIVTGDGAYGSNTFLTNDGGASWSPVNVSTNFYLRSIYFIDRNIGFIGASDWFNDGTGAGKTGNIFRTTDGGHNWAPVDTTPAGIYDFQFTSPLNGVAMSRYGTCYWTTDGGLSWNNGAIDQNTIISRMAFINSVTGFAASGSGFDTTVGMILRTDDGGHSWRTIKTTPYYLGAITATASGDITVAGYTGKMQESTDGGLTWTESTVGNERWICSALASQHRTVTIGVHGKIITRDR